MNPDPPLVECPFCDNPRDLERRGPEWFCPVCGKVWRALNRNDERLLRTMRIKPS